MAGGTPYSISRQILQRAAKAEERRPLRVIAVEARAPVDLRRATLAEAAPHLVIVEAHGHDDLSGVNVVAIPAGQEKHPLFEDAEVRRRSRLNG